MAGQGQGQGQDSSSDVIWLLGILLVAYLLIKFFFGAYVTEFYLYTRLLWVKAFYFVFHTKALHHAYEALEQYPPDEWNAVAINNLASSLKYYLLPLFGLPLAYYAYRVRDKNPVGKFKRQLDRPSLNRSEVKLVPWIAPVIHRNLIDLPIDQGPWAMGKKPLEFAHDYRLIQGKNLDALRAEKLFASQLGPLWEGPDKLKPHLRALFACFIAQVCNDKKAARQALATLTRSIAAGKPDYGFVDGYLKKYYPQEAVQALVTKHAYVTTVMCATLEQARRVGILPPNYFVWLRPVHRSLWYTLDCLGRRTFFPEVAGIHAHLLAEKVSGHAIERPFVHSAVKGMDLAIHEVAF